MSNEVGAAANDAGLWAAEEFVAGEDDEVDATFEAFLRGGFVFDGGQGVGVHHGARAEVFDERDLVFFGESCELGDFGFADESVDVEVGAVDFEDEGGLWGDGLLVVVEVGFVGGAYFDEFGARSFEDFWDPESAANFDEFGSGDDDFVFAFLNKSAEGEDEGGGTVVDGGGSWGFEEAGEGGFEVAGAFSSGARGEVKFEVGVSGGDGLEGRGGSGSEWGASEVGVDEDSGAVDDGLEARVGEGLKCGAGGVFDVFPGVFFVLEEELAEVVDLLADEEVDEGAREWGVGREGGGEFFDGGEGGEFAHGGFMMNGFEVVRF